MIQAAVLDRHRRLERQRSGKLEPVTVDQALSGGGQLGDADGWFDLAGESVNVSASIGLALRSDTTTGAEELIREADEAMYAAKRTGKGRVVRFAPTEERAPVA